MPDPAPADPAAPPRGPRFSWRRITRSPRGAAGLAIVVAALLLWPFAGWSAIPWLAGIGLLLLLRLLRLDGLLRGWALHLGGLAVVGGLMLSTGPWAWALAASIGVLLAGLAQLPWWRLAAVGTVLCLVSGVGFGFATHQDRLEVQAAQTRAGDAVRTELGTSKLERVLPTLMEGIAADNPTRVCGLLVDDAEIQFVQAAKAVDCPSAVRALASRIVDRAAYIKPTAPTLQQGPSTWQVDACSTRWPTAAAGPQLGRLLVEQTTPGRSFVVTGFQAC